MKKFQKQTMLLTLLICTVIFAAMHTISVSAAATPRLNKTAIVLPKGKTTSVKVSGYTKKTKKFRWTVSGKSVKIIKNRKKRTVRIKAVKTGTSTLKLKVSGKTLKCKVRVVKLDGSKSVSLSKGSTTYFEMGKKVTAAASSDTKIVKVKKSGTSVKITAVGSGTALITVKAGNVVTSHLFKVSRKKASQHKTEEDPMPEDDKETEQGSDKPTGPSDPGNPGKDPVWETETEEELLMSVRRKSLAGVLYKCNSDKHTYTQFLPPIFNDNWSLEEVKFQLSVLFDDEKAFIEEQISQSGYPKTYKETLIDIIEGRIELTEELRKELDKEFFDMLSDHTYACKASSSDYSIYFYSEVEYISQSQYDSWLEQNTKPEWNGIETVN